MSDKVLAVSRRLSLGPLARALCVGIGLAGAVPADAARAAEEGVTGASTNLARVAGKLRRHDTRVLVLGDSTFATLNDGIGFWSAALHQWRPIHWRGFGYHNPGIQNGYNGLCGYNRGNAPGSGLWTAIYPGDVTHPSTGEFGIDFVGGYYNHDIGGGPVPDLFSIGLHRDSVAIDNPYGPICTDADGAGGLGRIGTTIRCETDLYHRVAGDWLDRFTGFIVNFDGANTKDDLSHSIIAETESLAPSDGYVRSTIAASMRPGDATSGDLNFILRVAGPDGFNESIPTSQTRFIRGTTRLEREDVVDGLFMQSIARGGWTINFHGRDPSTRGDAWWPTMNRGTGDFHRGYSDAALDRIVRANRIDTFIVSLGINDALSFRSAADMAEDFEVLLDRIEASYQRVWDTDRSPFVLILAPWHLRDATFAPTIARAMEDYETALRGLCRDRIGLISLEALHQHQFGDLDEASPLTTDLVHPNKFGANIMMREVWNEIERQAAPAADLDLDGDVDAADFGRLLQAWGEPGGAADLNDDGQVNPADIGRLFVEWGRWLP